MSYLLKEGKTQSSLIYFLKCVTFLCMPFHQALQGGESIDGDNRVHKRTDRDPSLDQKESEPETQIEAGGETE